MRSLARACAAALPLLGLVLPSPTLAEEAPASGWQMTESDDDGSPLAFFPLPDNATIGQFKLACDQRGEITLSVDMLDPVTSVTIANRNGGTLRLPLLRDGAVLPSDFEELVRLYRGVFGATGGEDAPVPVPLAIASDRESGRAVYDFRPFMGTVTAMRQACTTWAAPMRQVAATAPAAPPPRTRVGTKFEDYCRRHSREKTKEAQCACLVDNVVRIANRDNPGVPNYPDVVMSAIYASREAMVTGSSPEYRVRMGLVGFPGNPAANPAQLITRSIAVNDEAVVACTR